MERNKVNIKGNNNKEGNKINMEGNTEITTSKEYRIKQRKTLKGKRRLQSQTPTGIFFKPIKFSTPSKSTQIVKNKLQISDNISPIKWVINLKINDTFDSVQETQNMLNCNLNDTSAYAQNLETLVKQKCQMELRTSFDQFF